jgi:TolB-like protein
MAAVPLHKRLLVELKRRRVFRTAAGYGAGAFVVLQVAELLGQGLQLGPAFLTAITVLTLLGFPVALILAWVFEKTPAGEIRRTDPASSEEIEGIAGEPRIRRWTAGILALGGTMLLVVGAWLVADVVIAPVGDEPGSRPVSGPAEATAFDVSLPSVAVLPLRNIGGDPADEYFSDGVTDDIINQLAKIGGLTVISRTSAMAYKAADKPLREIAAELGASALLEGSVRRAGGRVRIVTQLVDAETDATLWGETYDRDLEDVFAIQSEVAQQIAGALEATLSVETRGRIALRPTADTAAYELYLKGRFFWNQRSVADLQRAIGFFEQAIARDSSFAHAWAGLADSYFMLPFYGPAPPREWIPRARRAAERALALDPDLAEARATLAYALAIHDWDWEASDREFRRAIAVGPGYSTTYKWYSDVLSFMGQGGRAMQAVQRAVELDPRSPNVLTILGLNHWFAGDEESAVAAFDRALELDSNFPLTLKHATRMHWNRGDTARFFAAHDRLESVVPVPVPTEDLRRAYAEGGPQAALRLQVNAPGARRYPVDRARWHVLLGDLDAAFVDLEQALEERTVWLPFVVAFPDMAPLRADARYQRLLERLRLAP